MSCSSCTSDGIIQRRKEYEIPQIGYSLDELNAKRQEPVWKVLRYLSIALFWAIWAGLLAASIVIIVLNNHDVASTTTTKPPTTAHAKII